MKTALRQSSDDLFAAQRLANFRRTDRIFAALMLVQWAGAVVLALWLTPTTWTGTAAAVHPHLWLAICGGGLIASLPVVLALRHPGGGANRYVIAIAQVLFSSLLIHVTGGRIETHFHIFVSLAFLAMYRDWRVLIAPVVIVAIDHFVRGELWPETVFGVLAPSPWRWVEHAGWLLFEAAVLVLFCRQSSREMRETAARTAALEAANEALRESDDLRQARKEAERERAAERARQETDDANRNTAEALADSAHAHMKLEAIMRAVPDILYMLDTDGTLLWWNGKLEQVTGRSAGEIAHSSPLDYCDDGDHSHILTSIQQALDTGYGKTEVRLRTLAGIVPYEFHSVPMKDSAGHVIGLAGSGRDISERLALVESLRAADERFQLVSRATNDAVWDWDMTTNLLWWSEAFSTVFGYRPEEIEPGVESWSNRIHPEDKERVLSDMHAVIDSCGQAWSAEYRFRRADGSYASVYDRGFVIRDAEGRPVRMIGSVADQTERATAQQRLRESEARLAEAQRIAGIGSWEWDITANRTVWSDELYHLLGIDPQGYAATNEAFWEYVHPDDLALVRGTVETALRDCRPFSFDYRSPPRDGISSAFRSVGKVVTDEAGRPVRMVGIIQDVTEAMRIETDLRAATDAAEAANRAKSEFLANMSHEIRTPMNGVIGLTDLVLDTVLNSEQRQYLNGVKLSADALLRVINDILDFSKIEAGKLSLEEIDFDLRENLCGAVDTLALRTHEKGLELTCEFMDDVPDALVGDPARLWQVLINLVNNALKFTQRGEVAVRVETESRDADSVRLRFSVSDTGIGIPLDKQQSIFSAFTQADSATTRQYGGTGLGLAISAQLVEMMGGNISVESEPGRGSTFSFTASFGLQASPKERPAPLSLSELQNLDVLVIDDNATNRRILRGMLAGWGMRSVEAESGAAGLDALHAATEAGEPIKLILLDVIMPDMDGFTLLERIRRDPKFDRPTILMLSSVDRAKDIKRSRALGTSAYLVKPVRPRRLLHAIKTAMAVAPSAGPQPATNGPPSPGAAAASESRCLRILVAEDNPVNQLLAVHILTKAGHVAAVANNGVEVLRCLDREAYDLVLMDIQMPEMDGFQATAEIRRRERGTGRHLPILAVTALAMEGDRERCLEAGMDGYISKPIQKKALFAALASVAVEPSLLDAGETDAGGPAVVEPQDPQTVDDEDELDLEFQREIAGLFLQDCPRLMSDIRGAIVRRDGPALKLAAHTLKGSAGVFKDRPLVERSLRMELAGRDEAWDQATTALPSLEEDSARLLASLAELAEV